MDEVERRMDRIQYAMKEIRGVLDSDNPEKHGQKRLEKLYDRYQRRKSELGEES